MTWRACCSGWRRRSPRREHEHRQTVIEAQIAALQAELEKSRADLEQVVEDAQAYENHLSGQQASLARLRKKDAPEKGKEQR
jgi:predicted  nucleic acid-binding Zn-ribbon protein